MDKLELKKTNLLALLLSFEKYWIPHFITEGELYFPEIKETARNIIVLFEDIYEVDDNAVTTSPVSDMRNHFIRPFKDWLGSGSSSMIVLDGDAIDQQKSYSLLIGIISNLEKEIGSEFGLPFPVSYSSDIYEVLYKNTINLSAQLPMKTLSDVSNSYIEKLSLYDTIVIVGDIRRSQDLMTYGCEPNTYRENIIEFTNKIRNIVRSNIGIFDHFTGDGFIAYFNEYMCEQAGNGYYEMAIKSCKEIKEFASPFLEDWSKNIRRLPMKKVGLSIGVDSGKISFKMENHQLLVVGDACVWATRMSDVGEKDDVIVNNIPYQKLLASNPKLSTTEIDSVTKSGEQFKAFKVDISELNFKLLKKQKSKDGVQRGAIS